MRNTTTPRLACWRGLIGALAVAVGLVAGGPVFSAEGDAATTGTLANYFNDVRTLEGRFIQETRDDTGALIETAEGRFWLARGERFRWHYQSPWEQVLVADGEQLWVHDVDLEQVTVRPLDEALGVGAAQLLSGQLADLQDSFRITAGSQPNVVRLQPSDPAWDFQRVDVTFANGVPVRLRIEAGLGDRITVEFSDLRRNGDIDPARFTFEPPAGVDLIEGS